ncbi:MAG TPA: DUF4365 domain-containing protein [Longimicrobium sp.]|jgi:hypothetical protein|uniref:DUF4365 domain-containing protein n=1 Tax=Longimicrobium sp. TaxID=2029185 RepID=UPI002EDA236D
MGENGYPIYGGPSQLAELSERFFVSKLPPQWAHEVPRRDYGVDLRVEICNQGRFKGQELLVQLKSSTNRSLGASETVRLRTSTYNYLWEKLQVVMLVKYIAEENEAYWILFRDIPPPNEENQTFTVHIPKENRLSDLDWSQIYEIVDDVHFKKLNANRQ